MKLQNLLLLPLLVVCLCTGAVAAPNPVAVPTPKLVPAVPNVAAHGYILQDYHSGKVLAEKNADQRMEPASLTKLMTAYVVFSELRAAHITLDDTVRVSKHAWRTPGSRMFIKVDTDVPVNLLIQGMIIQSGNDASVALAEHIAGSEEAFASLMNQYATRLGMSGTHFANATGLPNAEHYSTPRDMATLARALVRDFPEYYHWYSERKFTYNKITQYNRNKLLWRDDSVDGMKTGHTESAGYCLVASAKRDGMRLVSVVMGTKSEEARARESQKLLGYGFRFFETHQLYEAGKALKSMRIYKGTQENLPLGLTQTLYVTVPRGRYKELSAAMTVDRTLVAPAQKGERFGSVQVSLGGEKVAERPLVALDSVPEGGIVQRLKDSVLLWFN